MRKKLGSIKDFVRSFTPSIVTDLYRTLRYGKSWYDPTGRSVPRVFSEIYRRKLWGTGRDGSPFYSGPGSDDAVSEPYVQAIKRLIDEYKIRSVVDLGCGDFRVASRLLRPGLSYHGLDVVKDLIRYNSVHFSSPHVQFTCGNATTADLPDGELCLIRQVLQHLSNEQVAQVLKRCRRFPFVVVTEHLPDSTEDWTPNLDIHHGNETRVDHNSGLVLDQPPFNCAVALVLCEVPLPGQGVLRSVLLTNDLHPGATGDSESTTESRDALHASAIAQPQSTR